MYGETPTPISGVGALGAAGGLGAAIGVAGGGTGIAANTGTLAFTGIDALSLGVLAAVLMLMGLLLVRLASVRGAAPPGDD